MLFNIIQLCQSGFKTTISLVAINILIIILIIVLIIILITILILILTVVFFVNAVCQEELQ